jgi:hypothetical protein
MGMHSLSLSWEIIIYMRKLLFTGNSADDTWVCTAAGAPAPPKLPHAQVSVVSKLNRVVSKLNRVVSKLNRVVQCAGAPAHPKLPHAQVSVHKHARTHPRTIKACSRMPRSVCINVFVHGKLLFT